MSPPGLIGTPVEVNIEVPLPETVVVLYLGGTKTVTGVGPPGVEGLPVIVDWMLPPDTDVVMNRDGAKTVTGVGPPGLMGVPVTVDGVAPPRTVVVMKVCTVGGV
jgi:hypothetical protein